MQIRAGQLRDRVTLLRPTQGVDAQGGAVVTYAPSGERWARRLRFAPTDLEREGQRQGVAQISLLMRLDSETAEVTTEWRVLFEGQPLQVDGVDRRREHGSIVLSGTAPQE